MAPRYAGGKNFVSASRVSYMWLSPSKTGKPSFGVIKNLLKVTTGMRQTVTVHA
jgi:hypothetical protein